MKKFFLPAVVVFLFVGSALHAAPLLRHVPANALIYMGWNGNPGQWAGYRDSHAQRLMAQSQLPAFFNRYLPAALNQLGKTHPPARMFAAMVWPNLQILAGHPWAFYFAGLYHQKSPGTPLPRAALLVRAAGPQAQQLLQWLSMLCHIAGGNAPQSGRPPLAAGAANGLVYLFIGTPTAAMRALLQQQHGPANPAVASLENNGTFKVAMRQVRPSDDAALYVNLAGLRKMTDHFLAAAPDSTAATKWHQFANALHLKRLEQFAAAGAFYHRDFRVNAFLSRAFVPQHHVLINRTPAEVQAFLRQVPIHASGFSIHNFNLVGLYQVLRMVAAQSPGGAARFDRASTAMQRRLGVNLNEDIFHALGSTWLSYADSHITGSGTAGTVWVNHLRFPGRLAKALPRLATGLCQMISAQAAASHSPIRFRLVSTTRAGVKIDYIDTPLFTPAWCFSGHNLYVGLYPQTVLAAVQAARQHGPSIPQNPVFKNFLERIGKTGALMAVAYQDLPRMAPRDYSGMLMLSRLGLGILDISTGLPSPAMVVPTLPALEAQLDAAGTISWSDTTGWHWRSISPFPGSSLLALGGYGGSISAMPSMATSSLLIAILLPSLAQAHTLANRAVSSVNERSIVQSCIIYAQDNNQQFPPNLAALVADGQITAKTLVVPGSGTAPANLAGLRPTYNAKLIAQQAPLIAQRVKGHCDYIYAGAGMMNDTNPSAIIVYERPGTNHGAGCNVAFGDDHVSWIPDDRLRQVFQTANRLRKKAGLSPLPMPTRVAR